MLKNLLKKKQSLQVINTHEADAALRLMFEIAISDGALDKSELKLIKKRADKIATEDEKASTIVKKIIDETSEAFSDYSSVNADYASFAAMALNEFKLALSNPDLTAKELRRLLRKADQKHRAQTTPDGSWSSFMASYVMQNVNDSGGQIQ